MRVENNNVSGQNHDPEQIDLIDLLVQLWRGKMTIIISVIVAIALAIGYLAVAKEKWTSTAIVTQPDVGQIAGYTNAMNVIYGPAVPKVSDIQTSLIGRYSTAFLKWSTKTGHRVRVFSSIDFPIRLVVTHHYIRAVLVRCNIQRYSPLLRELHR